MRSRMRRNFYAEPDAALEAVVLAVRDRREAEEEKLDCFHLVDFGDTCVSRHHDPPSGTSKFAQALWSGLFWIYVMDQGALSSVRAIRETLIPSFSPGDSESLCSPHQYQRSSANAPPCDVTTTTRAAEISLSCPNEFFVNRAASS